MDKYIIVIEVDFLEARRCYQKGMDDLNIAWPELYSTLEMRDKKEEVRYAIAQEKFTQEYSKAEAKYNEALAAHDKYRKDYKEWQEGSKWSRGEEPTEVSFPEMHSHIDYFIHRRVSPPYYQLPSLKELKQSLQNKINLVNLAQSNFRMTEPDVQEMIAWGDGSKVGNIKKSYLEDIQFTVRY